MPNSAAAAFLRRVRTSPREWPHQAIVEHLLREDPIGLRPLTSRALLAAGVLLPTDVACVRVAERIASDVVRDVELPEDVALWLERVALDAACSLLLDGLDALDEPEQSCFLSRLASCLGLDEGSAREAHAALHGLHTEHIAALRAFLPPNWREVALVAVDLPRDGALANEAIRHVIRRVRGHQ